MIKYLAPLILLIVTVLFLTPFFRNTFFKTDDGVWAVVRLASIHNELRQGQIPVRWSGNLNFGYGYPLFNFSYPAPYYLAEIFKIIGLNYEWSIKFVFILATLVSVGGMYLCAQEIWKNNFGSAIAAILYCAQPYRWINMYVRGSLGEIVAFAVMPFLLYAGFRLLNTGKRRYLIGGSLSLALLIVSHNIMAILFVPFFITAIISEILLRYVKFSNLLQVYIGKYTKSKSGFKDHIDTKIFFKHIHWILLMLCIGIALSAFFWLPAIYELKYTKLAVNPLTNIESEMSKIRYLFSSPFDNRAQTDGKVEQYYNTLSVIFFIVTCGVAIISYIETRKAKNATAQRVLIYTTMYVFALILMTQAATVFWKYMPILSKIDFPWRLNGIIMVLQPLIIGSIALRKNLKYPIGVVIAGITIMSLFYPKLPETQNFPDEYYATNQATTTSAQEYINRWMAKPPDQQPSALVTERDEKKLLTSSIKTNTSTVKSITYTAQSDIATQINIMYFPGWQLKIDGQSHPFTYENGFIQTILPRGAHTLEVRFANTPIREIANIISIGTLVAGITIFAVEYIKKEKGAL